MSVVRTTVWTVARIRAVPLSAVYDYVLLNAALLRASFFVAVESFCPEGGNVQRITVSWWYQLGTAIRPLRDLTNEQKALPVFMATSVAKPWVDYVASMTALPTTRTAAIALSQAIDAAMKSAAENFQGEIGLDTAFVLRDAVSKFETILQAELAQLDTYYVVPKGNYSTASLIDAADAGLIGSYDEAVVPAAARLEMRSWGRCFAFNLPTASGFHILRATEIVVRNYITRLSPKQELPDSARSWGKYVEILKKLGAEDRVVHALDQIRELHRNPLMHPEDVLDLAGADALYGLAKSVIVAIASDLAGRSGGKPLQEEISTRPAPLELMEASVNETEEAASQDES